MLLLKPLVGAEGAGFRRLVPGHGFGGGITVLEIFIIHTFLGEKVSSSYSIGKFLQAFSRLKMKVDRK